MSQCFNPRPRTGGDELLMIPSSKSDGFNPRPRTGGDPPRARQIEIRGDVSIHAPARGATKYASPEQTETYLFQSTPPHGGRPKVYPKPDPGIPVSIHAPARGATSSIIVTVTPEIGFNPRPRTGGDFSEGCFWPKSGAFQSTPPHGGRPPLSTARSTTARFQSTPPHGGRLRPFKCCLGNHFGGVFREPLGFTLSASVRRSNLLSETELRKSITSIANLPAKECALAVRVRRSKGRPHHNRVSRRGVRRGPP